MAANIGLCLALALACLLGPTVRGQAVLVPDQMQTSYPFYMQSPLQTDGQQQQQPLVNFAQSANENAEVSSLTQRATTPGARAINQVGGAPPPPPPQQQQQQVANEQLAQVEAAPLAPPAQLQVGPQQQTAPPAFRKPPAPQAKSGCLYDKRYFAKLDECLARKPYPTLGLPAFRNEDLLVRRGLSERHGCVFILTNGLFKSHQISRYTVDSDSACLDTSGKVQVSLNFANASLHYLWTLRCLNQADQLLEDATLGGKTLGRGEAGGVCVGSSQNFGFTALQLSNIEAQMEFATDIYKNWRLTNGTVLLLGPQAAPPLTKLTGASGEHSSNAGDSNASSAIRDFTFESLDGDELNWRYLHLYQNWARNRLHTNFLDQFKRFIWISLQRCLAESADQLPVKLNDPFAGGKYTR